MSSDLLAEFDSFYKAPQNNSATSSNSQAPSATNQQSPFNGYGFVTYPSSQQNATQTVNQNNSNPPEKDIWGDFSSFMPPVAAPQPPTSQAVAAQSTFDPWGDLGSLGGPSTPVSKPHANAPLYASNSYASPIQRHVKPGVARVSTMELFSNNIADLAEDPAYKNMASFSNLNISSPKPAKATRDENVLFDAEENDEDDDDDFGDFETVEAPPPQLITQSATPKVASNGSKPPSALNLGSNTFKSDPFPYPQAPKSPSYQERNPFSGLALSTPAVSSVKPANSKHDSPVTAWPVYENNSYVNENVSRSASAVEEEDNEEEDEWGDFADLPAETLRVTTDPAKADSGIAANARKLETVDGQTALSSKSIEPTVLPPSNIPPPSILLSIFPQLFDLPQSRLFKAVGSQPFSLKNRILSDPSTINFLRAYILLATVAARVIAGRKLRWKRDTHLAQAMSIGPAAAGGKGGMKLAGIDRAEATREDRESAEVVRVWREQVGRLRSAVATANSSLYDQQTHLVVPEISEVMPLRTLGNAEGGVTAAKACIVCGLKRDERITKVDGKVEDSFGEWWIDHWGHRTCRNFWQEHEVRLRRQ